MQQCGKIASYRSWFWSTLAIQVTLDGFSLRDYIILFTELLQTAVSAIPHLMQNPVRVAQMLMTTA